MSYITDGTGPFERPRRWPLFVDRFVGFAVVPGDPDDVVRAKRLFTAAMWASIATSSVSVYQLYSYQAPWASMALCFPIVAAIASLLAMRWRATTYPGVMHLTAASTLLTTSAMVLLLGGVYETAGNTAWATATIIGAAAIFADRRAHLWLVAFIVVTIGVSWIAEQIEPTYELPSRDYFAVFNLILVTVFVYFILYYFVRQSGRLFHQSERLLHNTLPASVVERLKVDDRMIAEDYESASILFADLVGFTPLASGLRPEEVIEMLNEVFTTFDDLVGDRGLEKIKTMGDAYLVAAGVPDRRDDHAKAICDLALAMQVQLATRTFGGRDLSMRIGVASGPITAGIIGRTKFSYDIWGETVNLASRMQTTGTPGTVQLTATTMALVAGSFSCELRGEVDVKGVGPVETWILLGPVAEGASTGTGL